MADNWRGRTADGIKNFAAKLIGDVLYQITYEKPIASAVDFTAGATVAAGRWFAVNATTAGTIQLTLADGSTHTVSVQVGYFAFPFAVTGVVAVGTTAVGTFTNLS